MARVPNFNDYTIIWGHRLGTYGLGYSPDGQRLMTLGDEAECLKLWDPVSGREVLRLAGAAVQDRLKFRYASTAASFSRGGFSPDSRIIVATAPRVGTSRRTLVWRAPSFEELEQAEKRTRGTRPALTEDGGQTGNSFGSTTLPTTLSSAPPRFTAELIGQVGDVDGKVTWSVQAVGTAPLLYQWQHNGVDLAGQTNSQLVLQNVQSIHSGQYSVRVSNRFGSATSGPVTLTLFRQITDGPLLEDSTNTQMCAWGDYNNDGWIDLFVTHGGLSRLVQQPVARMLYHRQGDGTFTRIPGDEIGLTRSKMAYSTGCAWGDYDNDGWMDLYVAAQHGRNFLYRNKRDGTFSSQESIGPAVTDAKCSMDAVWVDYDNDGHPGPVCLRRSELQFRPDTGHEFALPQQSGWHIQPG